MNKKAQIKIQQTAFMLIAVTLFFVLVGLGFFAIRFYNLKETANILQEESAMLLVSKLANSPEFSCGNAFGTSKINCIDEDKIIALKKNIEKYSGFWDVAKIEIRRIYPNEEIISIFSKNAEKTLPAVSNFVSLCRKETKDSGVYDKCDMAKLIIISESKE